MPVGPRRVLCPANTAKSNIRKFLVKKNNELLKEEKIAKGNKVIAIVVIGIFIITLINLLSK